MTQNTRVAELDFDTIKENLKAYISSKPGFTDYDYEGSGLAILIDTLAYNTHYNAVLANMLAQEMFLDTAVKRETVSLHAKRVGYTPRSARTPVAEVSIEVFPTGTPTTITIAKNTAFASSDVGGQSFKFITREAKTIPRSLAGTYVFPSIKLYEGTLKTFKYVVNTLTPNQAFIIPDRTVDTSTLRVSIQTSTSNTETFTWSTFDTIDEIKEDTRAFFVKLNENQMYEVYFGDGVIGKQIQDGNIISLEYISTNRTLANGASTFSMIDTIDGESNILVTTVSPATGGMVQEGIESIRKNAQNRVLTQNRAVVASDYSAIIPTLIPVDSVSVWGGQDNNPPIYGKVFISIKPAGSTANLSTSNKQTIISGLKKKMMTTIIPEIVDPTYTSVIVDSVVYYNQQNTNYSSSSLETIAKASISEYGNDKLNKFEGDIRYSGLLSHIDSIDKSFVSNITKVSLKKNVDITTNITLVRTLDFSNPLKSILSNRFLVPDDIREVYIKDNNGILSIYTDTNNGAIEVVSSIGTIDYNTGIVSIKTLVVDELLENNLTITAQVVSNDLISMRNNILVIDPSDITATMITQSSIKTEHIFTPS